MTSFARSPAIPLLLVAALAACSSPRRVPEASPLAFHVALIPTEIHDTSVSTATPSEPVYAGAPSGPDDDMRLELSTDAVSRALCDELGAAFVRATLLELPDDPAALAALGPVEVERYWQERAREAGADLLVRTRLLLDPSVDGGRNEKFWLNLPLFLLGGPMCYFVGDRSYALGARLQAEVFDVSEGHEVLDDYALLAIPLHVEFDEADLRFLDRASGAGVYALSLLVPSGLLARETASIEGELEERVPRELGRELAAQVLAERAQFEQNLTLGAFALESRSAKVERGPGGRVSVRVPVQELSRVGALHRYELCSGSTLLASSDFSAAPASAGRRVIEAELELPDGVEYLGVRVTDGGANVRSYTLRIASRSE